MSDKKQEYFQKNVIESQKDFILSTNYWKRWELSGVAAVKPFSVLDNISESLCLRIIQILLSCLKRPTSIGLL
jgi:hypothetical protein